MALASALNVKPTRKSNGMAVDHHVVPPGKGLRPTAPVDPFAPMSPTDIHRTVNGFVGMYGAPQTDAQIQATAQGEINPIIAAITKNATDRATASSAAIKGITGSYAKELAGIDFTSPYKQAEGDQAAVDAALQQTLAGAGSDLASQLKARLGMLNDPAVAQTASGLESYGAATGATQVAQGSNALSALIAAAAAAGSYGQKLPALARLSGIQGVEQANSRAANDVASGTQTALGQLPSIVNALRSDNSSLRGNRANAAAQIYETLTGQNVTKATAKAGLENQNFDNGLNYANTFGVDPVSGVPVKGYHLDKGGNVVKNATPKAPKQPSTTDLAKLSKAAEDLRYGVAPKQQYNSKTQEWMDVPNTGTPNASYSEAYDALVAQGASPKWARAQVNRLYKPGQFGRPKTAAQKAKANGQADARAAIASGTYGPQLPAGGH